MEMQSFQILSGWHEIGYPVTEVSSKRVGGCDGIACFLGAPNSVRRCASDRWVLGKLSWIVARARAQRDADPGRPSCG